MSEQAVLVRFIYGQEGLDALFELEERLESAIGDADAGEYDGHEVAVDGSDGTLYMYGPDADQLLAAVLPVLTATEFMRNATVIRRYGPPEEGVREETTRLS